MTGVGHSHVPAASFSGLNKPSHWKPNISIGEGPPAHKIRSETPNRVGGEGDREDNVLGETIEKKSSNAY